MSAAAESATFTEVTAASQLTDGSKLIYVVNNGGTIVTMGPGSKNTQRDGVSGTTVSGTTATVPDVSAVTVLTLETKTENNSVLYWLKEGGSYLTNKTSGTDLATSTEANSNNVGITIGTTTEIRFSNGTNRVLWYSTSGKVFKAYSTSNTSGYLEGKLYKLSDGTEPAPDPDPQPDPQPDPDPVTPPTPGPNDVEYTLVSDASQIVAGVKYVYIAEHSGTQYAMSSSFASNTLQPTDTFGFAYEGTAWVTPEAEESIAFTLLAGTAAGTYHLRLADGKTLSVSSNSLSVTNTTNVDMTISVDNTGALMSFTSSTGRAITHRSR